MNRLRQYLVLLCLPVLLLKTASAQAKPTAVGPGSYVRIGGGVADYKIDYGQNWLGGYQGWIDANEFWRWGVEGEVRWLKYHQDENVHTTTYLVGPRVSLLPQPIEPYVKFLVGAAKFNYPFNYARGSYFVMAPGAGVDLHVGERLVIRAVDVEYQRWPQFSYGQMRSFGISAGISYSIFRKPTKLSR